MVSGDLNFLDWEQVRVDLQRTLHKKGPNTIPVVTFSLWHLSKNVLLGDNTVAKEQVEKAKDAFAEAQLPRELRTNFWLLGHRFLYTWRSQDKLRPIMALPMSAEVSITFVKILIFPPKSEFLTTPKGRLLWNTHPSHSESLKTEGLGGHLGSSHSTLSLILYILFFKLWMLLATLQQTIIGDLLYSKNLWLNDKTYPRAFGKGQIWFWCGPKDLFVYSHRMVSPQFGFQNIVPA